MRYQFLRIIPLSVLAALCGGCSMVETVDATGKYTRQFSVPSFVVNVPKTDGSIGNIKSLGVVNSPLGTTIGYSNQQVVIDPAGCKVVIWARDTDNADAIRAQFESLEGVCIGPAAAPRQ